MFLECFLKVYLFYTLQTFLNINDYQSIRHSEHGVQHFLITFVLSVCFQTVEIQRVWSLHNVLLTLDDNKEITELLLQCFHRPVYIRNDDVSRTILRQCVYTASLSLDDICFYRGRDSWCFFSTGTSTLSVLFTAPSRIIWSSSTSMKCF